MRAGLPLGGPFPLLGLKRPSDAVAAAASQLLEQSDMSAAQELQTQKPAATRVSLLRGGALTPGPQRVRRHKKYLDPELQQRAVEYDGLSKDEQVGRRNVLPLPHWEKRKSLLIRRLAQREVRSEPCRS